MVKSSTIGFPRVGPNRELKKILESFWKEKSSFADVEAVATELKKQSYQIHKDNGVDVIPMSHSLYDFILDIALDFGIVPKEYSALGSYEKTYFALARGYQKDGLNLPALPMKKWFDTNYHYLIPNGFENMSFDAAKSRLISNFKEAKALGFDVRPSIVGPWTVLNLSELSKEKISKFAPKLCDLYLELFEALKAEGCSDIAIEEPIFVTDSFVDNADLPLGFYSSASEILDTHLVTYFDSFLDFSMLVPCGFKSIHIDVCAHSKQLDIALDVLESDKNITTKLSLGVVNGRNVWVNNLQKSIDLVEKAVSRIGSDRVIVSTSCSLSLSPFDTQYETKLSETQKSWLAFAVQKVAEVKTVANFVNGKKDENILSANEKVLQSLKSAALNQAVQEEMKGITEEMYDRKSPFAERYKAQQSILKLPLLPSTTIGSFPQTADIRKKRNEFKKGIISAEQYEQFLKDETASCVKRQEECDIDVLVHGEFERNDMVEYFGEHMDGFLFTSNGWVQSYGSRCVKPPVIFGDISRPNAMTVKWSSYAQSLTKKAMKGMLTGPITMMKWSFVREDESRENVCKQLGLAIRKEVSDLQDAGINVIQVDEPAIREAMPIQKSEWTSYLKWAVDSFKLSVSCAHDTTQIHTHMCYSQFNDIMSDIARLDADVISIETSRSNMKLLESFSNFNYPNAIGPGVYDIHSPNVPTHDQIRHLLAEAMKYIPVEQLWVNPDCGLKTRGWDEVGKALKVMVEVADEMRSNLDQKAS